MPRFIDKTGKTFGSLEVIAYAGKYVHGGAQWLCRCNLCGREVVCRSQKLGVNKTCSPKCGVSISNTERAKHGCASRTSPKQKVHHVWSSIKQRCTNPKNTTYKSYGGRGISMYSEWMKDFTSFYAYIGEPPNYIERWTIERIDNNKGYEPDNIKWALPKEQASNRRTNVRLTYEGETLTIQQWAYKLGMSPTTLIKRKTKGKSVEEILKPKNVNYKKLVEYMGGMYTLREVAKLSGVPYQTIYNRNSRGAPLI